MTISENSIFANGGVGIDLVGAANGSQAAPWLDPTPRFDGSMLLLEGELQSLPDADHTIEFFVSSECDLSGFGEGEQFVGSIVVTTDESGFAAFATSLPWTPVPDATVSATATHVASGNTCDDWTSVTATPGPAEGHMWPRGGTSAPHWIMEHPEVPSCAAGHGISPDSGNGGQNVGGRGGYGGIYCFALNG